MSARPSHQSETSGATGFAAGHDTRVALSAGADRIVDAIIDAVCRRRLPPGAKLGENQLAEVFGVSRTTVRRALHQLSFMGIAHSIANRGTFIVELTQREAADLFAARRVIEKETVTLLAEHCTAVDIRTLREHVALERELEATGNAFELAQLRGEFHVLLARLAGNMVLADILVRLLPQTALIRAIHGDGECSSRPSDEHEQLLKLLARGNVQACVKLMNAHLKFDRRRATASAPEPRSNLRLADALSGYASSAGGAPGRSAARQE